MAGRERPASGDFRESEANGLSMTAATGGATKKQAHQFPISNFQFLLSASLAVRE
jgi:hypothetical protein